MDRGEVLFSYRPPRAHPILPAGLIVFGAVFLMGAAETLLRDARPILFAIYALPLAATALLMMLLWPSATRIHADGVAPSRPLVARWWRPFTSWHDVAAVYPCYYDVTGAFVSPFASSDGKVTQMGIAVERRDGSVETVRFTPSRLTLGETASDGYEQAMAAVRQVFAARGRRLVEDGERIAPDDRERMLAEARKPFLPFFAIVLLLASAAPVIALLVEVVGLPVAAALPLALVAPASVMLRSWTQSRRRNAILNRIAKSAESG